MIEDNLPPATIPIPKQLQDVKPEYSIPLTSPYGRTYKTTPSGKQDNQVDRISANPGGEATDK